MEFRPKRNIKPVINIAPIVDVLFLLLIFFMVTSTFVEQPNIKLELPKTKYSETTRIEMLVLTISRDGEMFLRGEPILKSNLEKELRRAILDTGEETLVLKADRWIPYGEVINVMDHAKGAGFKKIIAPTIMDEGK